MVMSKSAFLRLNSALPEPYKSGRAANWAANFRVASPSLSLPQQNPQPEEPDDFAQTPATWRRGDHRRRDLELSRRRSGYREGRPDRADDRPAGLDRQADRSRHQALSGPARHD